MAFLEEVDSPLCFNQTIFISHSWREGTAFRSTILSLAWVLSLALGDIWQNYYLSPSCYLDFLVLVLLVWWNGCFLRRAGRHWWPCRFCPCALFDVRNLSSLGILSMEETTLMCPFVMFLLEAESQQASEGLIWKTTVSKPVSFQPGQKWKLKHKAFYSFCQHDRVKCWRLLR